MCLAGAIAAMPATEARSRQDRASKVDDGLFRTLIGINGIVSS